ncbi:DNA repair protein (XPGC)/ Rad, partial [Metarhizium majus ARSEF 297]
MGVNGLWTVVQPCARPTNLATLNRKRLAVDASIWIYQFLKAVRDKEGNALRNSHVVGFFRRICKLLWFGIQPVFVFDGGAPALKRATIQRRQRRREGRREDALRTAGKLLAVQMQRIAVEEEERRKRVDDGDFAAREEEALREEIPDTSNIAYVDEIGMTHKEKMQSRRFHKQDAYHLPELEGGIAPMGKSDDPRIMSIEELEEYARQFNNGEDINLYDFSKIDFDGDFFKSLPPPDRYNILNAARLRSRLRMGLSKDQLDDMFPDRMAFSRFQIERVKERNHLTQRLMYEVGMVGTDLTLGVNARVAGEKDREYILVKNEGVEGGWALGVVSKEKDIGEGGFRKQKITDQIAQLKYKEPNSPKIVVLEQELVRAEAESLVAEAQLSNITREKVKAAYTYQFDALREHCEKVAIIAGYGKHLLELIDDTPVTPGETRQAYDGYEASRAIIQDCEDALTNWVTANAAVSSKLSTRSRTLSQRRRNNIRTRNEGGHDLSAQDAPLNDGGSWVGRHGEESEEEEEEEEVGSDINAEARGRTKEALAA